MRSMSPDEIRQALGALASTPHVFIESLPPEVMLVEGDVREAAVLIPLVELEGQMCVLLTRRTDKMRSHSGEISFPGGSRDPEDETLLDTALRESWEEVSLEDHELSIFGLFLRMPTVTNFDVWAFVAEFEDLRELVHNVDEVDHILYPPLALLAQDGVHRVMHREYNGQVYPIHFFDVHLHGLGAQPVWGATAYMLFELLRYLGMLPKDD